MTNKVIVMSFGLRYRDVDINFKILDNTKKASDYREEYMIEWTAEIKGETYGKAIYTTHKVLTEAMAHVVLNACESINYNLKKKNALIPRSH